MQKEKREERGTKMPGLLKGEGNPLDLGWSVQGRGQSVSSMPCAGRD